MNGCDSSRRPSVDPSVLAKTGIIRPFVTSQGRWRRAGGRGKEEIHGCRWPEHVYWRVGGEDQGTSAAAGGTLHKSWKAALMSQGVSGEGSKRKHKHTHCDYLPMAELNEKRNELQLLANPFFMVRAAVAEGWSK